MPNDNKLQHRALAELNWEPSVTAAHIAVIADNGVALAAMAIWKFRAPAREPV